jgi:hypothetical protein
VVGLGEVGDELAVEAFGWDGQDSLDDGRVLGVAQCGEAEQCVHGGQTGVSGADAVAALLFQVVQERAGQGRVQIGDRQVGGLLAGALRGKASSSLSASR